MKKYLLVLFSCLFVIPALIANSPIVYDADGKNITNTSVTVAFENTESDHKFAFFLRNTGENSIVVSRRKVEINVLAGTDNEFCFAGKCNSTHIFTAPDKMTLAPNATTTENDSYARFYPNGKTGNSTIRYEFFSDDESFETVFVEVTFTSKQPTKIAPLPFANVIISNPYPNPARGHTNIDYVFTPDVFTARIIIRSLTGQVVQTLPLNVAGNSVRIDTSSLNSGMYFYSIELNNQVFLTKRLIVGS